jgi:hypothetical protein
LSSKKGGVPCASVTSYKEKMFQFQDAKIMQDMLFLDVAESSAAGKS